MPRSTSKPVGEGTSASARSRASQAKRRKNLSLNDQSLDTIEQLKTSTDATTATEIVRRALKFYAMAVEKEREGGRILYEDRNGKGVGFILL